jgi:MFS family permease
MFNAVNGLGAGGQVDAKPADNANVALYATFSVVGFFAGTIANRLGIRLTLSFGGFGYGLYVGALLCYNHTQNSGFLIFAGAMLGVCAGLLWTAQGAIMMAYPPENSKGRYISWFWMIFNLGAVIGSLIPLGENLHVKEAKPVSDGTYIGFIVLMVVGATLGLILCNADAVVREDGSKVILMKNPTWKTELWGLVETFKTDPYVILLFPMFFASNWFYTYQFNGMNAAHFNLRTRALNNTLYWTSQIIGAFVFGYALDMHSIRRSIRAKACWTVLFAITMVIWGGGYAWQKQQVSREVANSDEYADNKLDFEDSGYIGPVFLYMFYGFYDAAWQTCIYWYVLPSLSPPLNMFVAYTNVTKVYGRPLELRPQNRQLRRLLQGHPIRRCRHLLAHRRPGRFLQRRVREFLGLARWCPRYCSPGYVDQDWGYGGGRGGSEGHG